MPSLQDQLFVLFPNAQQPHDYLLQDDGHGEGPYLKEWNLQAPQPTPEQLAAVTQEQVNAARMATIRSSAVLAAIGSTETSDTATRAAVKQLWTTLNDHAEIQGYIMSKLGITKDQFVTDITARRVGITFEQTPTDPGLMFDELTRLAQSMIVKTLGQAIATGVGDPIKV